MNPILPRNICIPDPEAHVWADGRLYVYGSRDIPGSPDYCSPTHSVFSTTDLIEWTDHGTSFDSKDCGMYERPVLSAPDCAQKDGKYYLYFCIAAKEGREGVAVSDQPTGPFHSASPVEGADFGGIDPAAFVDEDGQAYLYWGQFELKAARLNPDMRSIVQDTYNPALITEAEHGFHEGSCMRKVNGKYYLVYADISRGLATCLSYAVSDSPLGPFEKRGVIIDNVHCDPRSWNNHGSIECFDDKWYVFYHRSSQCSFTSRRACIEPIEILSDGTIPEVEMTTQGVEGPIPSTQVMEVWRACQLYGTVHTAVERNTEYLKFTDVGDFAAFKYLEFSGQDRIRIRIRGEGLLSIAFDRPWNESFVEIEVDSPKEWIDIELPTDNALEGIHALILLHVEGQTEVAEFSFA